MKQPKHSDDEFFRAFDYAFQKDLYGGEKIRGGYLIAYSLEYARKLIYLPDNAPQWQDIHHENVHIGIAVHDEDDLHFVKGLTVTVTVIDANGFLIGSFEHALLNRPHLQHYGRNWALPGDGTYTLHVKVVTPEHQLKNVDTGKFYLSPVIVEFSHVAIKTGQINS